jgi:hypothetical protein
LVVALDQQCHELASFKGVLAKQAIKLRSQTLPQGAGRPCLLSLSLLFLLLSGIEVPREGLASFTGWKASRCVYRCVCVWKGFGGMGGSYIAS